MASRSVQIAAFYFKISVAEEIRRNAGVGIKEGDVIGIGESRPVVAGDGHSFFGSIDETDVFLGMGTDDGADNLFGAVGAAAVGNDDLVVHFLRQNFVEQIADESFFVQRGDDDAEIRFFKSLSYHNKQKKHGLIP